MFKSDLIKKISNDPIFDRKPIILMHIGAAGSNFKNWKNYSHNSILVIIDGINDNKLIKYKFKKIIKDDIFISNKNKRVNFYLTKDPSCSSLLKPNLKVYKKIYGSHRFKIVKKIKVKTISIGDFLNKHNINYIDYLTIDIQGMDLLIFKSIKDKIRNNISLINIECGFEKFYFKESSISDVINFFNKRFELSDMRFGLNYKLNSNILSKLEKKMLFLTNKPSKIYSNLFFSNRVVNKRTLLIRLIDLIDANKLFEAKNLMMQNLSKFKNLEHLNNELKKYLFLKKILFLITFPFFYLKKFLDL